MPIKNIFLLLLLLCANTKAFSVNSVLFTSDRLPSLIVNSIVQDKEGYVWIGTQNGLSRFDGYHFMTYQHIDNDPTSINHNNITSLFMDNKGLLWIGTPKGLSYYDANAMTFVHKEIHDNHKQEPRITQICQSPKGNLIIGTSGFGLLELSDKNKEVKRTYRYSYRKGDNFYPAIHFDKIGRFWRGDNAGNVYCFSISGKPLMKYQPKYSLPVCFLNGKDGSVFAVCRKGVVVFSKSLKVIRQAATPNANVRALYIKDFGLILGTDHGLKRIDANMRSIPMDIDNNSIDLASANINSLFEDKQHNLWMGCVGRGLLFSSRSRHGFSTWSFPQQGIKVGSPISSIASASDGGLWVSLLGDKIYHFTKDGYIDRQVAAPQSLNLVYRDHKGKLWVAAGTSLYRMNEKSGVIVKEKTFDCDFIATISDDGSGELYISTFGKGLTIYDTQTGNIKTHSMYGRNSRKGSLCNNWISSMLLDRRGLWWIATSSGVSCYNPKNDSFKNFSWNSILSDYACLDLAEDTNSNIYIGTDRGLFRFDRKKNKVYPFPQSGELKGKSVGGITTQPNGDFWCCTSMGIWHYRAKDKSIVGHVSDNGLTEREYTNNLALTLSDGRLVFGSSVSLVVFSPKDIIANVRKPTNPAMTSLIVGGKALSPKRDFKLGYEDNSFTLEFSNFDFSNAANITLEYRLNDGKWSQVARGQNSIAFNHMQFGSYKLQIRAEENGQYSSAGTCNFVILAPWYRSGWAYFVYSLLTAGAIYLYLRYRTKREQAKRRLQEFIHADELNQLKIKELKTLNQKVVADKVDAVQVESPDANLLKRIMTVTNDNLSNSDLNVDMIAQKVGLSRSQLHRKMRELMGVSPSEFIRNIRLEQAARLLGRHETGISDIAYAVGFNSLGSFSKAFKQHFGMSPTEYSRHS